MDFGFMSGFDFGVLGDFAMEFIFNFIGGTGFFEWFGFFLEVLVSGFGLTE